MTINEALEIAKANIETSKLPIIGSATLCLDTARECVDIGFENYAWRWVKKSLGYSVGVFHSDYKAVAEAGEPFII